MDNEERLFILAGNGPYENRGCEAIVRGTTKILREHFQDPRFICLSFFQSDEQYLEQCRRESDGEITHLSTWNVTKSEIVQSFWKPQSWQVAYQYFFNRNALLGQTYRNLLPYLDSAAAVLSIGGDNYSLDYGFPTLFTALDDLVLTHKIPLTIWGASVGPFSTAPDYERYIGDHLRKVTGIFARESSTIDYLKGIGVTHNVHPVADPAFLMEPVKPKGIEEEMPIEQNAIGLNFSPLMAKFVTEGDLVAWAEQAASIVVRVAETTEMPIYLIPHVTRPKDDDHEFLQMVMSDLSESKVRVTLVPPTYSAAETKWIISQMVVFAGSRTHATIAALSTGIPTLSLAYSIKALGINNDIFGHNGYCLNPQDIRADSIAEKISLMINRATEIRRELVKIIPEIQDSAMRAGYYLDQLFEH